MTGDDLKTERMKRGMTSAAFGEWLAERINADKPESQHVKAYTRQRVYEWESGAKDVPDKVEVVLLRERIARLERDQARSDPPNDRDADRDEEREDR